MKSPPRSLPLHARYWRYDLPGPDEQPTEHQYKKYWTSAPNNICKNYLELARSSFMIRGIGFLVGALALMALVIMLAFLAYMAFTPGMGTDAAALFFALCTTVFGCWFFIPIMRLDLQLPRDEPIRFNRLRRKVYFYQFTYDRIFFLSKRKWCVKPAVHAWEDLKAEACSVYAPGHGGLIENIVIAAHKPGTDQVIARYFFAHDIHNGEHYWAIARLFMQQGPDALPKFEKPARDWNNDAEVGFPRRLAPKVKWPADIDYESRTAPTEETK